LLCLLCASAQKLSSYNIDPNGISTSGISAGGAMSIQLHVAYSKTIKGNAVVAGPPYFCALGLLAEALIACLTLPSGIDLNLLYDAVYAAETLQQIDSHTNLTNSRVIIFTGSRDTVVVPGVVAVSNQFYQNYMSSANIKFINQQYPAAHGWPTNDYGNACGTFGAPYIINCNYDFAGDSLQWIYGNLSKPVVANGQLIQFDQSYYTGSSTPAQISLASKGIVYIPTNCASGKNQCKLHIAFHGCLMSIDVAKLVFAQHAGLNEWAEANNIIVLYPQATASQFNPLNPNGCFDWWGYTSELTYFVKSGPQMAFVANVENALAGSNIMH